MDINTFYNSSSVSDYLNILASYNCKWCIDNYMRVTDISSSCIGHIFTNDISNLPSYIVKSNITDQ